MGSNINELNEVAIFLQSESRIDVKKISLQYVLGLTGTDEGRKALIGVPEIIVSLLKLTTSDNTSLAKDACLALINLSADESCSRMLLNFKSSDKEGPSDIIVAVLSHILDAESAVADPSCIILSNLTRYQANVEQVVQLMEASGMAIDRVVTVFTTQKYNKKGANLHYLGPVFSNLSQSPSVRRYLLDRERCVIQRLLPFTEYEASVIRRGGIVGALRNCCFDVDSHDWLLSPAVDILPHLLLPLAGPEEFPDDEMETLPPDLQYLPESKVREVDPDIRCMLLEALTQLCATRVARENMRNRGVYLILREYHKWETDRKALLVCEDIVNILIRTEDEIGEDNLKNVEVPSDLSEKFKKMDEDFVKD